MSNFALQINATSGVTFTNSAALEADTKVYGRFRILGAFLKDQGNNATNPIFMLWDGTTRKLGVYCHHLFGGSGINFVSSAAGWSDSGRILDFSSIQASLSDTTYYEIEFLVDPAAATRATVTLYATDGTTVLATASANGNITSSALPTSAGVGAVQVASGGWQGSQLAMTLDWLKLGTDAATIQFDAEFNEGAGTSTADAVGSTTGTIAGAAGTDFAWVPLANPPDHGTVTLSSSNVLNGASPTASIQWYDAANNPIADPGTTWSVNSDSLACTINSSTGVITTVAAGTATIKAAAGAVSATAVLTVRPTIVFAQHVSVS